MKNNNIYEAAQIIKNGGYANKYFVEYVTLADDSEWIEIFLQLPDKYQEEIVQNWINILQY